MIIRKCATCGKELHIPPSKAERNNRFFCSRKCTHLGRTFVTNCEQCGKQFTAYQSTQGRKRYCSRRCLGLAKNQNKIHNRVCKICGSAFTVVGSKQRRNTTCSPVCAKKAKAVSVSRRKVQRTCLECGKTWMGFPSRPGRYCSARCNGKRMNRETRQRGPTSIIENTVADWLTEHGIVFERQAIVKHYRVDFQVGSSFLEVHGCYWHGCSSCFPTPTTQQKGRRTRDKALITYFRNRNIPYHVIWEHDIRAGDFSALMPLLS